MFSVGSQARRLSLLIKAYDAGLTHFDTAPYYGFGWAERDLGLLLNARPHASITTKVGLTSPGGESTSRAAVLLRKAAGKALPALSRPIVDFSIAQAHSRLNASLSRLGCEHLALYLLHEPEPHLLSAEEWQRWLDAEVSRGRIGSFGIAATAERAAEILDTMPDLARVVQIQDSMERKEADCLAKHSRPMQITYGYISTAYRTGADRTAKDTLRLALQRNTSGAVVVSTTKPERLSQYADLFEGCT